MDFGRHLAKIREGAGHNQRWLAEAAGLSQSEISQLESGVRSPTYKTICKLAKAMNLPPGYLLGDELLGLSASERALVRQYRTMSEPARRACERLVHDLYAREMAREKAPTASRPYRVDVEVDRMRP
jgi:transcriptional regulator with XRE-family HTH domain